MRVSFTVVGPPVTWKRAARQGRRTFTNPDLAAYQTSVRYEAMAAFLSQPSWQTDQRYRLELTVYAATRKRADVDNYAKAIMDALNKLAYADDSQVDELTVTRHVDPSEPRCEVTIATLSALSFETHRRARQK